MDGCGEVGSGAAGYGRYDVADVVKVGRGWSGFEGMLR